MRTLSRIGLACLILGGLACGSYLFGCYVLSPKLFGKPAAPDPNSPLQVVNKSSDSDTHAHTLLRGKPQAEVDVLPAQDAGPGPEAPSVTDTEAAHHKSPDANPESQNKPQPANPGDPFAQSTLNDGNSASPDGSAADGNAVTPDGVTPTPTPKHHHKPRHHTDANGNPVTSPVNASPEVTNSDNPNPDGTNAVPGTSFPKKSHLHHSHRPHPTSQGGDTSPLPQPESGGGGDASPVPQPG